MSDIKATHRGGKYLVIHGHFYQPPRENPWLDYVEHEPSAHPSHDWNERIAMECYIPNGMARINDHKGRIVDIVNNYEHLNFNFGPTLLSWYQRTHPEDYTRLIAASDSSAERLGHSNAIAQAYNHMILPLANFQDALTQIEWGLADYEYRFKRKAESIWLPETACSESVMKLLVDHRLKYVILAPSQAEKVRKSGATQWVDVSNGSIDPRRPYLWKDIDENGTPLPGRSMAVFFYDGPLSRAIAFEHATKNSHDFAERINACFSQSPEEDQLVHVATDGESYGHHQKFSDLTLAHLFRHELKQRGIELTNYGAYLEKHPPTWEVRIKPGKNGEGTSWSCAHGVDRWQADCGCGAENGEHQKWRAPLRLALNWLRDELAEVFNREGGQLFQNQWDARNAYISLLLDRSQENADRFFEKHAKRPLNPQDKSRAIALLEMQKYAMFMFTSCGWFFSEISRLEATQNLKYAARAIELASAFGYDSIEGNFVALLEKAPSNNTALSDGGKIYAALARPAAQNVRTVTAEYAIKSVFSDVADENDLYCFRLVRRQGTRSDIESYSFAAGLADITNTVTQEETRVAYCAVLTPAAQARCYVSTEDTQNRYFAIKDTLDNLNTASIWEGIGATIEKVMGRNPVSIQELLPETRVDILTLIHSGRMREFKRLHGDLFRRHLPIVEQFQGLKLAVPEDIMAEVSIGARMFIVSGLENYKETHDSAHLEAIEEVLPRIKKCGLNVNIEQTKKLLADLIASTLQEVELRPTARNIRKARKLIRTAFETSITHWLFENQNRAIRIFDLWERHHFMRLLTAAEKGNSDNLTELVGLYEDLRIYMAGVHDKLKTLASDPVAELHKTGKA